MSKIKLVVIFLVVVLVAIGVYFLLLSEKEEKVYRIGIISGADDFLLIADGFRAGMTKLGYVEGENIVYDSYYLNADPEGERQAAEKLAEDKADLIFAFPTEPSVAAKEATQGTDIPVVFAYAGIEGVELVESVREPGGNITGVRFPVEQVSKNLEILHELAPWVKRVWIGYDINYPNTEPALAALRPLASSVGVTLVEVPATTVGDFETDLAARAELPDVDIDAMLLMADLFNHCPEGWGLIRDFAVGHEVLLVGSLLFTVEQGAVFGNSNDLFEVGELAAPLVHRIFEGIPAGTIPVVTPEPDLWINYKVAQERGLTMPEELLNRAAEIIR